MLAARCLPIVWKARLGGRLRGSSFILVPPARFRIEGSGTVRFGDGVKIERGARIIVRGRLDIGDNVYISKNVTIVAFTSVAIGANTLIAENVSIHDEDHGPIGDRDRFAVSPVRIGDDVWLCAGSVVTRGVTIGNGTTVAANAVVVKDLPERVLAGGVPARIIKELQRGE